MSIVVFHQFGRTTKEGGEGRTHDGVEGQDEKYVLLLEHLERSERINISPSLPFHVLALLRRWSGRKEREEGSIDASRRGD